MWSAVYCWLQLDLCWISLRAKTNFENPFNFYKKIFILSFHFYQFSKFDNIFGFPSWYENTTLFEKFMILTIVSSSFHRTNCHRLYRLITFRSISTILIVILPSGTDDRCEPQPIPPIVVGLEKDWVSLAPYSLHYWEKLCLEPYSYSRDVAYIVVAPDNDFVLQRVRSFFKELSSCYEVRIWLLRMHSTFILIC